MLVGNVPVNKPTLYSNTTRAPSHTTLRVHSLSMRWLLLLSCLSLLLAQPTLASHPRHHHVHHDSNDTVYDPHNDKDLATHTEVRHLTQPDWSVYHTAVDIEQLVNNLAERHSDYVTVSYPYRDSLPPHKNHPSTLCANLQHGHERHELEQYCNGHRLQRATVTAPGGRSRDKLQLLLVFGEHGRELISSEIAVQLLRLLTDDTSHHQAALSPRFRHFILSNVEFHILPLLNIYGHEEVERGQTCQRKNVNGVDSNRNFDFHFNNSGSPKASDWPGPAPFSEIESSFIRAVADDLTERGGIDLYANVHSGIEELLCGWDYQDVPIDNYPQVHRMLNFIQKHHCPECRTGVAGVIGGYEVFGGSMDWMYVERHVANSLTLEVYQGKSRRVGRDKTFDCTPSFNPTTAHEMHDVSNDWASSFITASVFLLAQQHHTFYPNQLPNYLQTDASLLQPHAHDDSVWTHILPSQQDPEPRYLLIVSAAAAGLLLVAIGVLTYCRCYKSRAYSYQPLNDI